jgi:hypothetical protein
MAVILEMFNLLDLYVLEFIEVGLVALKDGRDCKCRSCGGHVGLLPVYPGGDENRLVGRIATPDTMQQRELLHQGPRSPYIYIYPYPHRRWETRDLS